MEIGIYTRISDFSFLDYGLLFSGAEQRVPSGNCRGRDGQHSGILPAPGGNYFFCVHRSSRSVINPGIINWHWRPWRC